MKKLLICLAALLALAGCAGQPGDTQSPPPDSSSGGVSSGDVKPVAVKDLLLEDYIRVYEDSFRGEEFDGGGAGLSLADFVWSYYRARDMLEQYAVYQDSKTILEYVIPYADAAEAVQAFFGTAPDRQEAYHFPAGFRDEDRMELRVERCEEDTDGGWTVRVGRTLDGRECYPAEYRFLPLDARAEAAAFFAPGAEAYRFVSVKNLPLPETGNGELVRISSAEQLIELAALVNGGDSGYADNAYTLEADIDLKGLDFEPIGGYAAYDARDPAPTGFCASLDGRNHSIRNLKIDGHAGPSGLFARVGETGIVGGINLIDCRISSDVSDYPAVSWPTGGVAGIVDGMLTRCYFNGRVRGGAAVGGMAGLVRNGGSLQFCRSDAVVRGADAVGGLAGSVQASGILNSTATGTVRAEPAGDTRPGTVGGFVGVSRNTAIDRGIVSVRVRAGDARTAGVFAGSNGGSLIGCFYNSDFTDGLKTVGEEAETASADLTGLTEAQLREMGAF